MVGGYVYFSIRLWQIKEEMRAQLQSLPNDQLEILSLGTEEYLNARVDAHEIKVEGKMYDVARIKKEGDLVIVFCVHDTKEDSLLGYLDRILSNLENDNQTPPHAVVHFSLLHYITENFNFQFSNSSILLQPHTAYLEDYFFFISPIDSPPPRI